MKFVLAIICGLILIAGIAWGGYELKWWLRSENTDRQVEIDNRNVGTQTAWRDEAYDLINQASLLPDNSPQRAALERQACENIGRLVESYRDEALVAFEAQECL